MGKSIIQESKTTEASKVTASKQEPKSDLKTKPEEEKSKDPEVTESSKNASLSEDSKKKEEEKSITAKKEDVKETPKQPPKETAKKVDGKKTDKSVEAENSDFDDELTPKVIFIDFRHLFCNFNFRLLNPDLILLELCSFLFC